MLEQEVRRVTEAATAAGVVRQLARRDGEMPRERARPAERPRGEGGGARRAAAAAGQQEAEGLSLPSHMAEPARKEGAAALTEVLGCRRVRAVERP